MSVRGNIEGAKHDLSAAEARIADFVLAKPESVLNMNVQALAKAAGVSASTVSRFSRRLQFSSYNDLKLQLSADVTSDTSDGAMYEEIKKGEDLRSIKAKLLNNAERSLQETVDQIRPENVEAVLNALENARQILLFGVGASYLVASNIAQKWSRLGFACVVSDDLNQILPLVVTTNANDSVLWLISNGGESPEPVLAAKQAKAAGVTVITTTKMGDNSLTRAGDISIQTSQPIEGNVRVAATQSLHAQFMLVDIVYYAFVSRHYTSARRKVQVSRDVTQAYKQAMRKGF